MINFPNEIDILSENNQTPDQENACVRNYSSRILTEEETRLLSKGAGFAITPKSLSIEDFIVATEETCVRLSHKGEKDALRGEINQILHGESPRSQISQTVKEKSCPTSKKMNHWCS